MKNNLFYYATSELSQDAFICWLASFALKESHSDPALKECAEKLIRMFVPELCNQKFILTNVERQFKHVDVLLTVEATHGIYKIIVEDKTYTSEHGNQLKDYLDSIKQAFPSSNVRGVYYKTGFQCNLSAVFDAGYVVIKKHQLQCSEFLLFASFLYFFCICLYFFYYTKKHKKNLAHQQDFTSQSHLLFE